MNLEYFISSLPMLTYGEPSPISEEAFREMCIGGLDGTLAKSVNALLDESPFDAGSTSAWVDEWMAKERAIRVAVANRRAARLGVAAPETAGIATDGRIENAVAAAYEEADPMLREKALDRLRWQLADEMQGVQPISADVVLAYAIKLRLVLRLQSLDEKAGKEKFLELTRRPDSARSEGRQ